MLPGGHGAHSAIDQACTTARCGFTRAGNTAISFRWRNGNLHLMMTTGAPGIAGAMIVWCRTIPVTRGPNGGRATGANRNGDAARAILTPEA